MVWTGKQFFKDGKNRGLFVQDNTHQRIIDSKAAVQFLKKEIKTNIALALYLSKEGNKECVQVGDMEVAVAPRYYKDRMREARALVNDLRKPV
ncbi:MAG TPA: hypothetical protein VLV89_06400 [Candidatus Acidoferrum sp.]|nr:hypothetical protein [Candidatus Acidoferrum sp.]